MDETLLKKAMMEHTLVFYIAGNNTIYSIL